MRAGTGCQIPAVFHQLHAPEVDFPVAFHRIFNGISGFCEGGRVQDHNVEFLTFLFQLRKQFKYIRTYKLYPVGKPV